MIADDFAPFERELVAIADLVGRRLRPETIEIYFVAVEDLPLAEIVAALRDVARTIETGQKLPTPLELRRQVAGRPDVREAPSAATPPASEPLVSRAAIVSSLRAVAPRVAPALRPRWLALADDVERRAATPATASAGPLGAAIAAILEREPGCDEPDETPHDAGTPKRRRFRRRSEARRLRRIGQPQGRTA